MALVLKDRVKETSTSTGTGSITLAGAVSGFATFAAVGNGNTTYYGIFNRANTEWEVGLGTYTASGTVLSRDTVLASSNNGNLVDFTAGTKEVFVTYPSDKAVYEDASGKVASTSFGAITADSVAMTTGTVSTAPTSGNDITNKTYVDTLITSGIHYHTPVRVESPDSAGSLNATYNNGTSGVGATLTNAGTQAALVIDGVTLAVNDRVLIYNQTNAYENGVYTVTDTGSVSTNWVLTRATDADSYNLRDPDALSEGSTFFVTGGNSGAGETYSCNTSGTIVFGTTAITFAQISDATVYTAGTGLSLTGTQFSISNVGTAGTYGSASVVPVITTNAQGQVTSVTNTNIAISSGAVSGLAASATTDTTNASNISSGTLGTSRLSGSYTGITGVGTLASGTWNASTIGIAYGGTGQTTANAAFNALAPSQSGNANLYLKTDGTNTSWAAVPSPNNGTLTLNVSGTGLSGSASFTADQGGNSTFTVTSNATSANTGSTIVARDSSGNFSAGTITANLSGNATTSSSTTGNAATATALQTARAINGVSFDGTANISVNTNNSVTFNNGGAGGGSGSTFNGSGALTVSYNTIGAPSTTGANASGTWSINITGNSATTSQTTFGDLYTNGWFRNNNSNQGLYNQSTTQHWSSQTNGYWDASSTTSVSGIRFYTGGHVSALRGYVYADTSNSIGFLNSGGSWRLRIVGDDYTLAEGSSMRAPLFYDSNDTGYYIDPNSTSRTNYMVPNRIKLVNNVNNEPRWDFSAYVVEAQHWYGNNSSQTMYLGEGNAIQIPGTPRAPIFYDYNDTGYYCDPNNSSSLNAVYSNNHYIRPGYMLYSDHGNWQGEYNKIQWHAGHLYLQNAGGGYLLILRRGDGGERFYCDYNGNVTASGNITAYSDARLKTNVVTISDALEKVKQLRGVTFDWISSGEHSYGLIAQEVEKVIPELVMETAQGTAEGDVKVYTKSVDYSKIVSVLIEAVKEQQQQIEELKARIK